MVHHLRFTDSWSTVHRLADGTAVRLRLLRPSDRDELLAGFARLSPESRYRRFFTAMPTLPEKVLHRLLDTDGWNHVAVGAEAASEDRGSAEGFGIARFFRMAEHPETAEAAVAVVDHMQHRGLGTLLVSTLAAAAAERGITKFRAEVLRTNDAAMALVRELDGAHPTFDGPVAVYELALPAPHETTGPVFHFLRLAARGLEIVLRRLDARHRGS